MGRTVARLGLPVAMALAATTSAHAQLSVPPDWATRPDGESLSPYYPGLAVSLGIEGEVQVSCRVAATGVLEACSVLSETPAGVGFGAAALKMSRTFQMRPTISLGARKPNDEVRIPVRFKLPDRGPAPPPVVASDELRALARRLTASVDPLAGVAQDYEATARDLEFRTVPGAPEDAGPAAAAALRRAAAAELPDAREQATLRFAQRLSVAELTAVVQFAETEAGKRYLSYNGTPQTMRAIVAEAVARRTAAARDTFCALRSCADMGPPVLPDTQDPEAPLWDVDWAQQPQPLDLARAWPASWMVGVSGYAQLTCIIGLQGAPEGCTVTKESPEGMGIADAALSLTGRYRLAADRLPAWAGRKVMLAPYFAAPFKSSVASPVAGDPVRLQLAQRVVELQIASEVQPSTDEDLAKLFATYPVADARLRSDLETALRKAAPAWRAGIADGRARALAAALDEPTLRAAVAFESGAGGPVRRAATSALEELKAMGKSFGERVASVARSDFCASRPCGAPAPRPPAANVAPGAAAKP